jgi:hypothetical protein
MPKIENGTREAALWLFCANFVAIEATKCVKVEIATSICARVKQN